MFKWDHQNKVFFIIVESMESFIVENVLKIIKIIHIKLADNLLTPMSSKMSMSFFLQSKRN